VSAGYDEIVVGARCAGSPTAMLLARKGYRVLVVDQCPRGMSRRDRPTRSTSARSRSPGRPGTDEAPVAYAPRRTVLDKLLVDAAS
jgi:flavin-dependent dehydrogenase